MPDSLFDCRGLLSQEQPRCFHDVLNLPDSQSSVAAAAALLSTNLSAHCDEPEDLSRLQSRGFAVLRNVLPALTRSQLKYDPEEIFRGYLPHCNTRNSEWFEGAPIVRRRPINFQEEVEQRAELSFLPRIVDAVLKRLAAIGQTIRPVSGEFFRLDPVAFTHSAFKDERSTKLHQARPLDWHHDTEYMLWIMLERTPPNSNHSGLEVAPRDAVARMCALAATDRNLRSKAKSTKALRRHFAASSAEAALERIFEESITLQQDPCLAMWPTRIFEHNACRNLNLQPGDGLLLLPGVVHRTADYLAPRMGVTFDLCPPASNDSAPICRAIDATTWLEGVG